MNTDWALVLKRALSCEADEVPDGWETAQQIADSIGIARATAAKRINDGLKHGVIEKRSFRVMTHRGLYPVPHYREVRRAASKKAK